MQKERKKKKRKKEKKYEERVKKKERNLSRDGQAERERAPPVAVFILECFVRLCKCNYGLPAGIDYRIRLSRRRIGFLNGGI